jgi:glycine/D-amino acid oxidase-like deaminating enzyme
MSGLFSAAFLQRSGWDVDVYESTRDRDLAVSADGGSRSAPRDREGFRLALPRAAAASYWWRGHMRRYRREHWQRPGRP